MFGLAKVASHCAASAIAVSVLPTEVDAHAFLLLPKAEFSIAEKNFYAYVVPGEKVPPFSSYTTGNAERNSQGFTANYKRLNLPTLKQFIMQNQIPGAANNKPGGTAECGFSRPNIAPQPLSNHIEVGNYNLQNPSGLHPGPCEAWYDNEIVIPYTEDCRTRFNKPIAYDKAKCQGKSRFTFYWLATHFAPFQVYIGCVPLQGGSGGRGGDAAAVPAAGGNNTPAPAAGGNNHYNSNAKNNNNNGDWGHGNNNNNGGWGQRNNNNNGGFCGRLDDWEDEGANSTFVAGTVYTPDY